MYRLITNYISSAIIFALGVMMTSCIEDGVESSPSAMPQFSVQTLDMGDIFTDTPSATHQFKIYNTNSKILNIAQIWLEQGDGSRFRLNVDGEAGKVFKEIEIRPNDSIYIFVEATVPPTPNPDWKPFDVTDRVLVHINGTTHSVGLKATAHDVETLREHTVTTNETWTGHPRRVFGTLTVAQGATLTIEEGVTIYFHDKASMLVEGSLVTHGGIDSDDPEVSTRMVTLRGDRLDKVVGTSEFDLLASQWEGLEFAPTSTGNILSHTDIRGTVWGVFANNTDLTITNSRLHRSGADLLSALNSTLKVTGTELSDSKGSLVVLSGGEAKFTHCTLANTYISSYDVGPLLRIEEETPGSTIATLDNCLLANFRAARYIYPDDITATAVTLRRAMLPLQGSDDKQFVNCLWGATVLTNLNTDEHNYDYRLAAGSDGIGSGDPALLTPEAQVDLYGTPRAAKPTIGAYEVK